MAKGERSRQGAVEAERLFSYSDIDVLYTKYSEEVPNSTESTYGCAFTYYGIMVLVCVSNMVVMIDS